MKRAEKSVTPLPSALTVANPAAYKPAIAPPRASKATSPAAGAAPRKPARQTKGKGLGPPSQRSTEMPASPCHIPESATTLDAPIQKPTRTVEVCFSLFEPTAKEVSLCGAFNDWSGDATPMCRGNDGHWQATLALLPGRYEYKFLVDGQWMPDLHAAENVMNDYGTLNSVMEIRARAVS
jgi:Glycogen recognition site of AMP-activated protein kinase